MPTGGALRWPQVADAFHNVVPIAGQNLIKGGGLDEHGPLYKARVAASTSIGLS